MIGLVAPLATALLAVLPLLWWLHRREPRPAVVSVPSLLFLEDEPPEATRPVRRRIDADLLLALAAAGGLTLAAAGPELSGARDGRTILVLLDASARMGARSADGTTASERASAVAAALTRRAGGEDRVEVVLAGQEALARRLREATRGLRVLVSDRRPTELPAGVRFVGVGDPAAVNAGIVSLDVDVAAGRRRAAATIWNDAATARTLRAGPIGAEGEVRCPAFGAVRASWDLGPVASGAVRSPTPIHLIDEGGAWSPDDEVVLDAAPLRVAFAGDPLVLPAAVATATRRALDATRPGAWTEDASAERGLFVGPTRDAPAGASIVLEIGCVPPGVEPVRPTRDDPFAPADPEVARDLDLGAAEWVYAPGARAGASWPRIEVDRTRAPSRLVVRWRADPSLGRPAALATPLWPLFVENVVLLLGGEGSGGGRVGTGVLDLDATRLGRDVVPLDEAAVDAAPRDRLRRRTELGGWFGALGSICLGLLWFRPRSGLARPVR